MTFIICQDVSEAATSRSPLLVGQGVVAGFSTLVTSRARAGIGEGLFHTRWLPLGRSLLSFGLAWGGLLESFVEVCEGGVRGLRLSQQTRVDSGSLQRILVKYTQSHALHGVIYLYLILDPLSSLGLIQKDTEATFVHAKGGVHVYLCRQDSMLTPHQNNID